MKRLIQGLVVVFCLSTTLPLHSMSRKVSGADTFKLCLRCHGDNAEGKFELAAPAIAGLPSWYIEKQLTAFGNGGRGKHPDDVAGIRMRSMARSLNNLESRKAIADYVSKLKPQKVVHNLTKGNAEAGKVKFTLCMSCHGPQGKGMKVMNAPPLVGLNDWYLFTQLKHFKAGIRGGDPAKDPIGSTMAPMAQTLINDQDIYDVISYIKTLSK